MYLKRKAMIDFEKIEALSNEPEADGERAASILERAGMCRGLSLEDSSALLSIKDPRLLESLYSKAGEVKERLFGKRVVLFAPLYLSNHCTNGCLYCGFSSANKGVARKALEPAEVVEEAGALEEMGFKRVLLVTGEDPRWGLDYIISCVEAVYRGTGVRIVHVNAPPMDTGSLKRLKASGAGVYQAFQETYHRPTYNRMHPSGRKKDFDFRLGVMDRAIEAGFEDVGIGPLLGLYGYRYDCLAAIAHSQHLYGRFKTHAHTISIPRLRPAGAGLASVPCHVTDEDLKKTVAVFRLAVPSAGVVVSTREAPELRSFLIHIGATQLSAGSRTNPGGYSQEKGLEQFSTNDKRPLAEVMASIVDEGYLPSLCTTCYRVGRVGHEFTEKTISGSMEKFCQANAILTLKEYISDHSKNGSKETIEKAVKAAIEDIKDPSMKKAVVEKLKDIEAGKRDLFF